MPIQCVVLPESWSKMIFKVSYNLNHSMVKNSGEISLSHTQLNRSAGSLWGLQGPAWDHKLLLVACPYGAAVPGGGFLGRVIVAGAAKGPAAVGRWS